MNNSSQLVSGESFSRALCDFLDASPTPFHAATEMARRLSAAGFQCLQEQDSWSLVAGQGYYVVRNQSSLIAWVQGADPLTEQGLRMMGAHTDSPCLRVKPRPDMHQSQSWRLAVEVYGGALLNPWFDRDLSLAGRVHYENSRGEVASALVDFARPLATIPSLAIHLDREANSKRSINAQTQLPVLLADGEGDSQQLQALLREQLRGQGVEVEKVLDHELSFYDTQRAAITGVKGDFIASARLDNLLSCFVALESLLSTADQARWSLLVCSDHEEVGSVSAVGAAGPFLQQLLQRLLPSPEDFSRAISQSLLISTDNAHALHPNYADKMDANHAPRINGGPVIKINANQRYASNSETQALFRQLCHREDVPVQDFVVRSDMACGSTIGPIAAAEIGVRTLDVGLPTYAMHSIRELAGSRDPIYFQRVLARFLQRD